MILVVGATGDLGARVVQRLRDAGQQVRALVRPASSAARLVELGVDVSPGDLLDPDSLRSACTGATTVVFTATAIARRLGGERLSIREVDEAGGLALVAAAESAGVQRFVHLSFPTVGAPTGTALERAKLAVEDRLRAGSMRPVIVRADAFQEIHLAPTARFDIAAGKVAVIGRGDCKRRWIGTDDVAALVTRLAVEDEPPEIVEVGGPEAVSKNDLIDLAERVSGRQIKRQHMPRPVARLAVRLVGRRNDALASAFGAGLAQDLVPATWDDSALLERGIAPTSASDFVTRAARASAS